MQKDPKEKLAFCPIVWGHQEAWNKADVVVGGFPCQDISDAGECAGISGERSGLWRYLCGAIRMVRPKYAIVENVAALLRRGMATVLGNLAEIGYDAEWHCIPASSVGAEHERDRCWIIANPDGSRELQPERIKQDERRRPFNGTEKNAAHPYKTRHEGRMQAREDNENVGVFRERLRSAIDASHDFPRNHWNHQPVLGRGVYGVPDRAHRIAALGNSVVPQVVEVIGRAIMESDS